MTLQIGRGGPARPRAPGRLGARAGSQPASRIAACRPRSIRERSTTPTGSPPSSTRSGGVRSPAPTTRPSRRRSAAAPTSRPTSSSRSSVPCANPTRQPPPRRRRRPRQDDRGRAWSSRSCSSVTAPGRRSSSARPACCLKWQDEMHEKFGLHFEIVNSETMKEVRRSPRPPRQPVHAVPADHRVDGVAARPARSAPAPRRLRRPPRTASPSTSSSSTRPTTSPRAARPAPTRSGIERRGYAVDSQRTRAVRDLAERAEHRLFLSAHPAQRLHRVVHRAAGDDRPAALRPRHELRREGAAGGRGPPPQAGPAARSRASPSARSSPLLYDAERRRGRGVRPAARLHPAVATRRSPTGRRQSQRQGHGDPAAEEALLLVAGRLRPHRRRLPRHPDPGSRRRLRRRATTRSSAPTPTTWRRARSTSPSSQALEQAKSCAAAAQRPRTWPTSSWLSDWGHRYEGRPDRRLAALLDYIEGTAPARRATGATSGSSIFTEYVDTLDWIRDDPAPAGLRERPRSR